MARPLKPGIDYLNLDCWNDTKMDLIEAEYGDKGFVIVVKLWRYIYRNNGYYCEWNDDVALLVSKQEFGSCGVNLLNDVVAASLKRDIFSKELYEKYGILTSRGIQKRYFSATAKRERVEVNKSYLLVPAPKNAVYGVDNPVSSVDNPINSSDNPQSKVKESKGKKSKVYIPAALPCDIIPQWEAFNEMRIKIKQPLTQRAADMAVNKLQSLAPDDIAKQGEILDQSTFNCWKGLFELKDEGGGNNGGSYKDFKPSRR